jgi:hypothetical protein
MRSVTHPHLPSRTRTRKTPVVGRALVHSLHQAMHMKQGQSVQRIISHILRRRSARANL